MHLYNGGFLVHQRVTDEGIVEVVDMDGIRSLHFGTYPRQSSMSLRHSHTLELSYTQAMMACLLFNPNPSRALVIGLGGGSLVKFLLHFFPLCDVVVVEKRRDVIEVATRYFDVPENHPRLTIHHDDGYEFVSRQYHQDADPYDLLLVDAYDHEGMSASVGVQVFFDACAGLLTNQGILSTNLWGSERQEFSQTMQRINQSFNDQSLVLPVAGKGNVIGLAIKRVVNPSQLKKLRPLAITMEEQLGIGLQNALQQLIRQNRSFLSRLFL